MRQHRIFFPLVCFLLFTVVILPAEARPRRVRKPVPKDKVIITPPTLAERAQAVRSILLNDTSGTLAQKLNRKFRIGTLLEKETEAIPANAQDSAAVAQLRAEMYFLRYEFPEAKIASRLAARLSLSLESRWLEYRWLFLAEDLHTVDSVTLKAIARDSGDVVTLLARGELLLRLLHYQDALVYFQSAERHSAQSPWIAVAKVGQSKALYKLDRYQDSFVLLETYLDSTSLSSELLTQMGLSLISLSRVNEAIELLEEAARWNPWNELAHYYLGNGYVRVNYSQLNKQHQSSFVANTGGATRFAAAVEAYRNGDLESAKNQVLPFLNESPWVVEPPTLLGSIAWSEGKFDSAVDYFRNALEILPNFGRAHNGLAKSLEALRMRLNVHRADDSMSFVKRAMPVVPRVDEFVKNWKSLSPRLQKQVAIAVDPWKLYLPVLIECGARYYIKPLYDKLSASPHSESLRDQRIEYDSRLWDDVRGCGGFTTVTGEEDVERSIFANYNTVLHELTHQVHGVFPPPDAQKILNAYHAAQARADSGLQAFMSRYQQSSVWEYFAEGANALYSPQRDRYDTRDIVRERLMVCDTTLARLVQEYVKAPNLEACYPVGLINAADDALERQQVDAALDFARRAQQREPSGEKVLRELAHIYSIRDQDSLAIQFADSLIGHFPQKAASYIERSSAQFFAAADTQFSITLLSSALSKVDSVERSALHSQLGNTYWYAGKYGEAAAQFRAILRETPRDPNALWGLALALSDSGDTLTSDSLFRTALSMRSGILELRLDFARHLLSNGRLDEAGKQLEEAQLLAHGDPELVTLKGWFTMRIGNYKEALRLLDRAVALAPDLRLAQILRLEARKHFTPRRREPIKRDPLPKEAKKLLGMEQTDVPIWIFSERKSVYVPARIWPQYQRDLLAKLSDGL